MNVFMLLYVVVVWMKKTLYSLPKLYVNFRGEPIILVNNKKAFIENLSMISQFLSQNHGDL